MHKAREDNCSETEYAVRLSQWADENFAMTALHPTGSNEEGQPRKDLWPPPEGTADPISTDRDPLVKMLMEIAASQYAILEDHLLLVNRVGLHSCSDYCLRTLRHPEPGLQPRKRVCRIEFGSEFLPGKKLHRMSQKLWKIIMELPALRCLVIIHAWFNILAIKCSLGEQMGM